jgi:hypothetical protein
MSISHQLERLKSMLEELVSIDLGYPQSENRIFPPQSHDAQNALAKARLSEFKELVEFYSACDGLSLPDIHNGYFIKTLGKLLAPDSSEPNTVLLESETTVIPFGSTGGGDLFVMEKTNGSVQFLPPSSLEEGHYDGRLVSARLVADSFSHFLEKLLTDVQAFVNGEEKHQYLTAC